MASSFLKNKSLQGPLHNLQAMNPHGSGKSKSPLFFSLNLTALIDAFAILVIFLLSNYNTDAQNIKLESKTSLPTATQSELMKMGTIIKVEGTKYYINDKVVTLDKIVEKLIQVKKEQKNEPEDVKNSLIIQADRNLDFEILSPLIRAGGHAGYNHYKFAVLPESSTKKM